MPASSRRGLARRWHARRLGVFEVSATPPARDLGGVRRRQGLGDTPYVVAMGRIDAGGCFYVDPEATRRG
jgi:hypothetical protein